MLLVIAYEVRHYIYTAQRTLRSDKTELPIRKVHKSEQQKRNNEAKPVDPTEKMSRNKTPVACIQ
jgi:hypothetical protein